MTLFQETLPLSELDVDRLEELLESDVFKGEAMLLDELQGFICSILSGPDLILPSDWIPVVLGDEPHYESDAQAEEVVELLMRFYNQIVVNLEHGRAPDLILYPLDEGSDQYDYAPWADAYLLGTEMGPTHWLEAAGEHSEELAELLKGFFLLNGSLRDEARKSGEQWMSNAAEGRALKSAEDDLPAVILAIRAFWKTRDPNPESPYEQESEDVGSGDACPCGSGRKFKQCCGDPKRLH